MNPLTLLDSLLGDWASPRVRRLIHGLLLLAAVVFSIWQAAEGDWEKFVAALVAIFYTASNVANTPTALDAPGVDSDPRSSASYEDQGGKSYPSEEPYPDVVDPGLR